MGDLLTLGPPRFPGEAVGRVVGPGPSRPACTQTKRDATHRKDGNTRHQFYARYTLPCPGNPDHDWWEPLLATTDDTKTGFIGTVALLD